MKMKKVACLAVSALMVGTMAVSLAACGGDDGLNADGSVRQITMWVGGGEWTGENYKHLQSFINDYNKVKPDGFEVLLDYKTDLEQSLQTSRNSGGQSDIVLWDRFNTATYSIKDYLYPVNDLLIADEKAEGDEIPTEGETEEDDDYVYDVEGLINGGKYYAPAMQEMTYEGKVYGLPVDIDIWGIYVNMKFVKEYDNKQTDPSKKIEPLLNKNWTWDDLLTVIEALNTTSVNTTYSAGDQHEHLFKYYVSTGHGAEYLVPEKGDTTGRRYQTNFDNDYTRDILNFFIKAKQLTKGDRQESDSFLKEICAMMNRPLYHHNEIDDKKLSQVTDYKFMPQPAYSKNGVKLGVNGGMVGGYGIAFPKPLDRYHRKSWDARHEAAWKFAKWLCCEKESMLKWSKEIGSLPALTEALNDPKCVENNQVLKDAREYALATRDDDSFVYTIRPQVPNYLTLQTEVINQQLPGFLGGNGGEDAVNSIIKTLTSNGNTKLVMGLSK